MAQTHSGTVELGGRVGSAAWFARRGFVIFVYILLIALAISMIFPYLWMLANSFKTRTDFFTDPYSIIPPSLTLNTYQEALTIGNMGLYIFNRVVPQ